jgi:hypothetical protein
MCAVAIATAAVFGTPGSAFADQVADYHPDQQSRDFAGGPGGWAGTESAAGVCVQDLTCPTVTDSWVATDGAGGGADGFLRASISNVVGAESTSRVRLQRRRR